METKYSAVALVSAKTETKYKSVASAAAYNETLCDFKVKYKIP